MSETEANMHIHPMIVALKLGMVIYTDLMDIRSDPILMKRIKSDPSNL